MKANVNWFLCLMIIGLMLSCGKKDGSDPTSTPTTTVKPDGPPYLYVVGADNNTPAYWRNGSLTNLSTYSGSANAIAIQGADVYIAGTIVQNNAEWAVYWKNGIMTMLGQGRAMSIKVQGTDVYVAGTSMSPTTTGVTATAAYWKNNVLKLLSTYPYNSPGYGIGGGSEALDIAVNGTDVYVVGDTPLFTGTISYTAIAAQWKNDAMSLITPIGLNGDSKGTSVFLQNSDVYIGGEIYNTIADNTRPQLIGGAVYWKNGTGIQLSYNPYGSQVNDIAILGSDVYATGISYSSVAPASRPGLWKNGTFTEYLPSLNVFTGSTASVTVNKITIQGSDVYIAGTQYVVNVLGTVTSSTACYWKNGTLVNLTGSGSSGASAVAIQQ